MKPTITQAAMHLVYPQTNSNWANEVDLFFFAEATDLDADPRGWLDPWSRPINKSDMSAEVTKDDIGEFRTMSVNIGSDDLPHTIPLVIYTKIYEKN